MADCMTQEDAMNMSNEQAKQILIPMMEMMLDRNGCPISSAYFALGKAVESLSNDVVPVVHACCEDCKNLESGDTLYSYSEWDGGINFDYIRNIKYCPRCGRKLEKTEEG